MLTQLLYLIKPIRLLCLIVVATGGFLSLLILDLMRQQLYWLLGEYSTFI
jgi:hypothetical protein